MIAAPPVTSLIPRLKEGDADTLLSASRANQIIDLLNALGAMEGRGGIKVVKSGSNFVITTSAEADTPDPFSVNPVNVFRNGTTYRKCEVTSEGADVLIGVDVDNGESIYIAKPFWLRKATVDARTALGFQFVNHYIGAQDVFSSLSWPISVGNTPAAEFIITRTFDLLPSADPNTNFPAAQVLVIHPHYVNYYITAPGVFAVQATEIDALQSRRTLFTFNPATLEIDADPSLNTESVTHLDLNTDGRIWLPADFACNNQTASVVSSMPATTQEQISAGGIMIGR